MVNKAIVGVLGIMGLIAAGTARAGDNPKAPPVGYYADHDTVVAYGGVGNFIDRHYSVPAKEQPAQVAQPTAELSSRAREIVKDLNNRLHFDTNSSDLKPDAASEVSELGRELKKTPTIEVVVVGSSDNIGSTEDNEILSTDRASAVRDVLIENGTKPDQVAIRGMGEDRPVADNSTEQGRALNRRAEILTG